MRRLRLPVPTFITVSHQELQSRRYRERIETLNFPVAVRSTYNLEDGAERSLAGHFLTRLNVYPVGLERAMEEVFASYPEAKGQEVIIQEMARPTFSGVLFAYRHGVWKLEYSGGREQKVVDGQHVPETMLLPQFGRMDIFFSRWLRIWRPYRRRQRNKGLVRPLIHLSSAAGRLLSRYRQSAPHGLDIEFVISQRKL